MVKAMSLSVRERLLLTAFYPQKGSLKDMRILRDISLKARFSDEERKEIGLEMDKAEGIRWDAQKAKDLSIELNDDEREFLKRQVNRVDSEEGFDLELLALADRIKEL